jgi:4-aminobutyrate aminotransferase-like enzyme
VTGIDLPLLRTAVPGPAARAWIDRLAARECPAVTARRARRAAALGVADSDPPPWAAAVGSNVEDVDGNVYVDLAAGFGVAGVGHRHPRVVAAGQRQMGVLVHAMGDAFPDPRRIELMEALCTRTGMDRVILGSSGSDAVEAAVKTAVRATGRERVLAFTGGYHGLAASPLALIGYHVEAFQGPFRGVIGRHGDLAEWGAEIPALGDYAAVIVEPVQGRGGMRAPPSGWLAEIGSRAREAGALVIHDEIFSGLGRCGSFLAADADGARPDLLCVGKALGGGFPISACVGTAAAMDAWGPSRGEAIHTQTFLGNPVGCAMALEVLAVIEEEGLVARAASEGAWLREALLAVPGVRGVTGRGLMLGAVVERPLAAARAMLSRGFVVLPAGEGAAEVLAITPPLSIARSQLEAAVAALGESLREGG